MSTVVMALEPIGTGGTTGRKPRRSFTGLRRKQINKLKQCLAVLGNQDFREEVRATQAGYNADLFRVATGHKVDKAIATLIARCTAALEQTS